MNFVNWIRALCAKPSDLVIAARDLEDHKRMLLEARKDMCWADKRVKFHEEQIASLKNYLEISHG